MSTTRLRLPESLHKQARELANKDNVSIHQAITIALADRLSALLTSEYLDERTKRGSRREFERVLAKVRDREPSEGRPHIGSRRPDPVRCRRS